MRKLDPAFKKILKYAIRGERIEVNFILDIVAVYIDYLSLSISSLHEAEKNTTQEMNTLMMKYLINPWLDANTKELPEEDNTYALWQLSAQFKQLVMDFMPCLQSQVQSLQAVRHLIYKGIPREISPRAILSNGLMISPAQITEIVSQLALAPRLIKNGKTFLKILNQHYYLISEVDSHGVSRDFLAQEIKTGEWAVVKQFHYEEGDSYSVINNFENEMKVTAEAKQAKGALRYRYKDVDTTMLGFKKSNKLQMQDMYLALSLQSGVTCYQLPQKVSDVCWLKRFRSMLSALNTLHEKNIFHGSLKVTSFLFDRDEEAALIGLRMAGFFSDQKEFSGAGIGVGYYKKLPEYATYKFTPVSEVYVMALVLIEILQYRVNYNFKSKKRSIPHEYFFKPNQSYLKLSQATDRQLISLLNQILQVDPSLRPTLKNCIAIIDKIISQSIENVLISKKIAFIEFDEVNKIMSSLGKQGFLSVARTMDCVYVLTHQATSAELPINTTLNLLTKEKVVCGGVLCAPHIVDGDENFISAAHQSLNERFSHLNVIQYFYITNKNSLSLMHDQYFKDNEIIKIFINLNELNATYQNELTFYPTLALPHLMLILKKLSKELLRLTQLYQEGVKPSIRVLVEDRIHKIMIFMQELITTFCDHGIRRVDIDKKLQRMETEMVHTNAIKALLFPGVGLFRSTGAQEIAALRAEMNAKEFKILN